MAKEERERRAILLVSGTPPFRDRRRQLPKALRYLVIAAVGSIVAALAFYLLRTIGY